MLIKFNFIFRNLIYYINKIIKYKDFVIFNNLRLDNTFNYLLNTNKNNSNIIFISERIFINALNTFLIFKFKNKNVNITNLCQNNFNNNENNHIYFSEIQKNKNIEKYFTLLDNSHKQNFETFQFDFIYIDTLQNNISDQINFWLPKLRPGGVLCGNYFNNISLINIQNILKVKIINNIWYYKAPKLNIYIYKNARKHVHDNIKQHIVGGLPQYLNTVPLSNIGIRDYFNIKKSNKNIDYYYMGQFPDGVDTPILNDFKYFQGNENKHICDIEGDWYERKIPQFLSESIITINGARREYFNFKMFVRPTFSFLLIDLAKRKKKYPFSFNNNLYFGFKGFPDPRGVRYKMKEALEKSNCNHNIIFNSKWMGQNLPNSEQSNEYIDLILNHTFSLCPMGAGFDSIRFFESCYFGRIPIIISDIFIPFEKEQDAPFYFQINYNKSIEEMAEDFKKIKDTDINVLINMSKNAQNYFENYIRPYFKDPTISFLKWLEKNK